MRCSPTLGNSSLTDENRNRKLSSAITKMSTCILHNRGVLQGRSQKLHVGGGWCAGPTPTPICLQSPTVLPSPPPPTSLPK